MKIALCIPFYDNCDMADNSGLGELKSRGKLIKDDLYEPIYRYKGHDFTLKCRQNYNVIDCRNSFINNGKSYKKIQVPLTYDKFMQIDSDEIWGIDDVVRLVNYNELIISGAYPMKANQNLLNAGYWDDEGYVKHRCPSDSTGVHKVDFVGTGFLCVDAEVFKTIEYPWFRRITIEDENNRIQTPEDYGFCILAKEKGYKILVDFDCKIKHPLTTKGVTMEQKQEQEQNENTIPNSIQLDVNNIIGFLTKTATYYQVLYTKCIQLEKENKELKEQINKKEK